MGTRRGGCDIMSQSDPGRSGAAAAAAAGRGLQDQGRAASGCRGRAGAAAGPAAGGREQAAGAGAAAGAAGAGARGSTPQRISGSSYPFIEPARGAPGGMAGPRSQNCVVRRLGRDGNSGASRHVSVCFAGSCWSTRRLGCIFVSLCEGQRRIGQWRARTLCIRKSG